MQRILLTVLLALAAGVSTSQAATTGGAYNWTGLYVGASVGGRWVEADWNTTSVFGFAVDPTTRSASYDSSAARIGGILGYNWPIAPSWVAGVEVDLGYADNDKSRPFIPGTFGPFIASPTPAGDSTTVKATWDGSLRARLGVLVNPATLLYATGGGAWQNVKATASCNAFNPPSWCTAGFARTTSHDDARFGWTAGFGGELALANGWLVRAEYRYADFGKETKTFFPGSVDAVTADINVKTHTGFIGLVYPFK